MGVEIEKFPLGVILIASVISLVIALTGLALFCNKKKKKAAVNYKVKTNYNDSTYDGIMRNMEAPETMQASDRQFNTASIQFSNFFDLRGTNLEKSQKIQEEVAKRPTSALISPNLTFNSNNNKNNLPTQSVQYEKINNFFNNKNSDDNGMAKKYDSESEASKKSNAQGKRNTNMSEISRKTASTSKKKRTTNASGISRPISNAERQSSRSEGKETKEMRRVTNVSKASKSSKGSQHSRKSHFEELEVSDVEPDEPEEDEEQMREEISEHKKSKKKKTKKVRVKRRVKRKRSKSDSAVTAETFNSDAAFKERVKPLSYNSINRDL